MGVVSPLGHGLGETRASLEAARDCVAPMERFETSRLRCHTAGQTPWLWENVGSRAPGRPRDAESRLHPASRMLMAAAREVQGGDAKFQPEFAVVGTTSGGMSFGENFFRACLAGERPRERAGWLANYAPQKMVQDAQAACGWEAPAQIVANACASGSNAIGHAWALVRSGQYQRVLCGGYDAICELVFAGFDSLQASTPERIRPFDRERTGLVLGEGAALLALEEWESAQQRGAPMMGEVLGYGISTDNHHLTQPHPSGIGPEQAMRRALRSAGLEPGAVQYINAHGTATAFNDATEGLAIKNVFGSNTAVSSTKSMMGHSLGAAGAIEAVFTMLALQHGFLPPNINFREGEPEVPLAVVANAARPAKLTCAISNSFGFGGTNASVVLSTA